MNLEAALRDLATALEAADGARGRDVRLRAARQVVVRQCMAGLGVEPTGQPSVGSIARLAAEAPSRSVRRACAVLLVHALTVPGLVPAASRRRHLRTDGRRAARRAATVRISIRRIDRGKDARAATAARRDRRVDAAAGADISELAGTVRGIARCQAYQLYRRNARPQRGSLHLDAGKTLAHRGATPGGSAARP